MLCIGAYLFDCLVLDAPVTGDELRELEMKLIRMSEEGEDYEPRSRWESPLIKPTVIYDHLYKDASKPVDAASHVDVDECRDLADAINSSIREIEKLSHELKMLKPEAFLHGKLKHRKMVKF